MNKTFLEFFSGIGLVRAGLECEGWNCLYANDISLDKKEIYELNFGSDHLHTEDVWKVSSKSIPAAFLATASFPCTNTSIAGDRKGLKGEHSSAFHGFYKLLSEQKERHAQPQVVMLENVQGLLTSRGGKDVAEIIGLLNKLNYFVDMIEVDAINFVPQSRPRIFVIGVQGDIASKVMAIPKRGFLQCNNSHPARTLKIIKALYSDPSFKIGHFDLPPLPVRRAALDSIIEPIPDSSHLWWNDERVTALMNQMSKNHLNAVTQAIALNKKSYFTVYRRVRKTGSMAEVRSDGVAGCLRTPRGGSSKQILLVCGNSKIQVRLMTPREYARLQGTSDSFQISTRQNDTTRSLFGLGDAVCVPVIRWIAANILNKIYTSVASEEQPSQLAVNEL